jgi:hypothetical protein
VWFGITERQALRRGVSRSVRELNAKIRAFINGWNDRCHPVVWTKTAEEILAKANRRTTSVTHHFEQLAGIPATGARSTVSSTLRCARLGCAHQWLP